jgi:hypothetical protein
MIDTAIKNYYTFFDEKLKNSTFIVLAITGVIMIVGSFVSGVNATSLTANTLQVYNEQSQNTNIIVIDGVSYKIELTKLIQ